MKSAVLTLLFIVVLAQVVFARNKDLLAGNQNVVYVTVTPPPVTVYPENFTPVTVTVAAMEVVTETVTYSPTNYVPTSSATWVPPTSSATWCPTSSTTWAPTSSHTWEPTTTSGIPTTTSGSTSTSASSSKPSTSNKPAPEEDEPESNAAYSLAIGALSVLPIAFVFLL